MSDLTALYPVEWMTAVDKRNRRAYRAVAGTILDLFDPFSVLDVGCGSCAIANYLKRAGVERVVAVDGSKASEEFARPDVEWHYWDAREGVWLAGEFDMVVCTEFAEHVPASCEQNLIDTIEAAVGRWLWFAACPPTVQKRTRRKRLQHLNEQPREYWLARMPLWLNPWMTQVAKERLKSLGCDKQHYIDNLLVFEK